MLTPEQIAEWEAWEARYWRMTAGMDNIQVSRMYYLQPLKAQRMQDALEFAIKAEQIRIDHDGWMDWRKSMRHMQDLAYTNILAAFSQQ
jgi:hypothetical protein